MKTSYFQFDRELWEEGVFSNCRCAGSALLVSGPKAVYLSPLLDSGAAETAWGRARLSIDALGDGCVQFSCAAADRADALPAADACPPFPRPAIESNRPADLPLFAAKGRYLRFRLAFHLHDSSSPRVSALRIDFPMRSIAEFLPAFYRDARDPSLFLYRFLALYQAPMEDLAEAIAAFPARLDADAAEGDALFSLAAWAGVEEPSLWPAQSLKRLIGQSLRLCARKGTRTGLVDLLTLYLGAPPLVIETGALAQACGKALYDQIYAPLLGSDRYSFYVLVEAGKIADRREAKRLQRIIDLFKPAHTNARLILLERFTVLGGHSYLGINSALSGNTAFELKDNTTLPFHTMIL